MVFLNILHVRGSWTRSRGRFPSGSPVLRVLCSFSRSASSRWRILKGFLLLILHPQDVAAHTKFRGARSPGSPPGSHVLPVEFLVPRLPHRPLERLTYAASATVTRGNPVLAHTVGGQACGQPGSRRYPASPTPRQPPGPDLARPLEGAARRAAPRPRPSFPTLANPASRPAPPPRARGGGATPSASPTHAAPAPRPLRRAHAPCVGHTPRPRPDRAPAPDARPCWSALTRAEGMANQVS